MKRGIKMEIKTECECESCKEYTKGKLGTTNEREAIGADIIALLEKHLHLTKGMIQKCTVTCAVGEPVTISVDLLF